MRCKSCNTPLTDSELAVKSDDSESGFVDMCFRCTRSSYDLYCYDKDHDYAFTDLETGLTLPKASSE